MFLSYVTWNINLIWSEGNFRYFISRCVLDWIWGNNAIYLTSIINSWSSVCWLYSKGVPGWWVLWQGSFKDHLHDPQSKVVLWPGIRSFVSFCCWVFFLQEIESFILYDIKSLYNHLIQKTDTICLHTSIV